MSETQPARPATSDEDHTCDICGQVRHAGSLIPVKPRTEPVWVCEDCQHMLTLRVDDTGTAGD